jgi:hypothetical protein
LLALDVVFRERRLASVDWLFIHGISYSIGDDFRPVLVRTITRLTVLTFTHVKFATCRCTGAS